MVHEASPRFFSLAVLTMVDTSMLVADNEKQVAASKQLVLTMKSKLLQIDNWSRNLVRLACS